MKQEVTR
jgi:dynein heavy chain